MKLHAAGLEYRWVPAAETPAEGSPERVMVVLHGRGDSMDGFDWLPKRIRVPGLNYLFLNAPDPYYTGFSWYDLPPNQGPGIERSRALLGEVFRELEEKGFAASRCVLFGFSQGCLMTLEFGVRHPQRFAAYVGVSGYCFDPDRMVTEASSPSKGGNWLITHGTADDVLPVERTRSQIAQLQKAGFNLEYREYDKDHTVDPLNELPYIQEWLTKSLQAVLD